MVSHGSHHQSRAPPLIPEKSKRRDSSVSSSRNSDVSDVTNEKTSRKMKFIITMGIALPVLAAIIGVVAWAVSADSVFPGPASSHSMYRSEALNGDLLHVIEDRSDLDFNPNMVFSLEGNDQHDLSRADDVLPNDDSISSSTEKKDDPLYIVHFVPTQKPTTESTSMPTSTVSSDILSKILAASKGTKPGIPQFVVFAPIPGDEDEANKGMRNNQKTNDGHQDSSRFDVQPDEDDDVNDDPDDRDYEAPKPKDKRKKSKEIARSGDAAESSSPSSEQKGGFVRNRYHRTEKNLTTAGTYSKHSPRDIEQSYQHPQPIEPPALAPQAEPPRYRHPIHHHQYQPPPPPIQYEPPPHAANPHYHNYAPPSPSQYPPQPSATDRTGEIASPTIRLNFGGGGGGQPSGGHSPLGLMASILSPILPKPTVDLKGKMMFGVVLENGMKFGGNKAPPPAPSYNQYH